MSFGDRLDALEQRYLAFHVRHAHRVFGFCLVMVVFNLSAYLAATAMVPSAASIFAYNALLFVIGAVANLFLAIKPKESTRTK